MRWRKKKTPGGRIIARYDYRDERGELLYQVRRHDPKGFSVRSATNKTVRWGERYRRVLYRLPELLGAQPSTTVFVVEGEKDVDRLWASGLVAVCNAFGGGKGKWTRGHSRHLRGRHVVILPDNDPTGAEHGRVVAKALHRVAASVRLIELPGLPYKGDVSDWLTAGHTTAELTELVEAKALWRPDRGGDPLPEPDWRESWERDYESLRDARAARRAIYGLPVGSGEKLLLVMLSEFQRPPQEDLAAYLGVTARRVRQMIASLVAAGFLSVTKRGRRNDYEVKGIPDRAGWS
jgi:hypothetical protein